MGMKQNLNFKKLLKLAGNLVVIAALVFVVRRVLSMDIDPSVLTSPAVLGAFLFSTAVQTVLIAAAALPWLFFTRSLSGVKIPYSAAMPVYTRSNIYKYLPGNVFQYVGRNQLAADMHIRHVDVACATILDILFCVLWTAVLSVILLGGKMLVLLEQYGMHFLLAGLVGIVLVAVVGFLAFLKFRERLKECLSRYAAAMQPENRPQLLAGIFYYLVHNSISALMYFVCLHLLIPDADALVLAPLTGAFLFAWIVGFVTPGAPGGIGIREGVMIFISGEAYAEQILLFVLVQRIASILADVLAFAVGSVWKKLSTT